MGSCHLVSLNVFQIDQLLKYRALLSIASARKLYYRVESSHSPGYSATAPGNGKRTIQYIRNPDGRLCFVTYTAFRKMRCFHEIRLNFVASVRSM